MRPTHADAIVLEGPTPNAEHVERSLPIGRVTALVSVADAFGAYVVATSELQVLAPSTSVAETNAYLLEQLPVQVSAAQQLQDTQAQVKTVASFASVLARSLATPAPTESETSAAGDTTSSGAVGGPSPPSAEASATEVTARAEEAVTAGAQARAAAEE